MVTRKRINSALSIFFWNITRRQAISPVAKFHHVLGRGFMIQRVILIFIKCLSANQKSTILHERMIYSFNDQGRANKHCKSLNPWGRGGWYALACPCI